MITKLEILQQALGPSVLRLDADALARYGVDRSTQWASAPSAVLLPRRVEEVQLAVRLANEHGLSLVPSGGRTGLSGGAVACQGEVVLSLERMDQILAFSAEDQSVTVGAGMITRRLQDFARQRNLCYPVDFASSGSSQIGGNIATNAGGIKVIRYGMTRDWVRGLKVVTGAGELLEFNGGLIKNNTGYDFRHLFIGSEGTLGIICEATMALTRAPAEPLVLVLAMRDFGALLPLLAAFKTRLQLTAFEFFSHNGLEKVLAAHDLDPPFAESAEFYALIELEDLPGVLDTALVLFDQVLAEGLVLDGVISQSLQEARRLWRLREDLSETLSRWRPYKNDISVPVSRLPDFMADADELVARRYADLEVVWFGHVGDGNLHLNILQPEAMAANDFVARCSAVNDEVGALIQRHGGSISAEHGVGLLKKSYLHFSRSAADIELMRQVKKVFDPRGILNPGKVF